MPARTSPPADLSMPKKNIVSNQLIAHLAVDLAHYLLDLNIAPDRLELLQTEQQRIEDRRLDLESGPQAPEVALRSATP